jgi:hypothetical protein
MTNKRVGSLSVKEFITCRSVDVTYRTTKHKAGKKRQRHILSL